MKTFCFLLAVLSSLTGPLFAQESALLRLVSNETPSTGTSTFQLQFIALENVDISSSLQWEIPSGMTVSTNTVPSSLVAGDTVYVGASLHYDINSLPFYPKDLKVTAIINPLTINAGAKFIDPGTIPPNPEAVFAEGKVYFTPYNTTEIWSIDEFMQMGRTWHIPLDSPPARVIIPKEDIPISDLVNLTDFCDEDSLDLVHIEGLAYDIPMFPSNSINYKTLPGDDEMPLNNAKTNALFFSGTVRGRLITSYTNDLGVEVDMPLTGVNIVLKDRDIGINQVIKQVHTDQNGFFVFEYNVPQEITEKNQLELFLKFKSRNTHHNIKTKEDNFIFDGSFEHTWELGGHGNGVNLDLGDVELNYDVYKTTHWAFQCWSYVEQQGTDLKDGLSILVNKSGTYFSPDGTTILGQEINSPFTRPTIRLTTERMRVEGAVYHEFGHSVEWQVSNRARDAYYWGETHRHSEENSSRAAFTEGWAEGFEAIIDAVYWEDDQEYGYNRTYRINNQRRAFAGYFERRVEYENEDIDNGLQSEYFIATAIYDLWDGPDKGLPEEIPGNEDIHGWNDLDDDQNINNGDGEIRPWDRYEDNISLPFYLLIDPFYDAPYTISEYVQSLLNGGKLSCDQRGGLSRVLRENRVVFDIEDEIDNERSTALDTDGFYTNLTVEQHGRNWLNWLVHWNDTYSLNNLNGGNISRYDITLQATDGLSDQMVVNTLGANGDPIVIGLNNNSFNAPSESFTDLCGGNGMRIQEGLILIGSENNTVHLTLKNGSLIHILDGTDNPNAGLELFGNSSLIIEDEGILVAENFGKITLHDNAQLIVRDGGSIVMDGNNSRINLLDNSKLVIEANAQTCFESPNNLNTNGRGALAIDIMPDPVLGWRDFIRAANRNYNPAIDDCLGIYDVLPANFGVSINASEIPDCNNQNFNLQLVGNTIPQDAEIYWYVPDGWINYLENQNGNFWLTNITGTINGEFDGGTVYAIIKSPQGIQQTSFNFSSLPKPVLEYIDVFTQIYVCNEVEIVDGEYVIPRIRATATGGTGPYTFDWTNTGNVNYSNLTEDGYDFYVEVDSLQPTKVPQVTVLTATDQLGCTTEPVEFTVYPSTNTWEFLPLAIPENRVQSLSGASTNNNIITDEDDNIFFTKSDGEIAYYYWDAEATYNNLLQPGLWKPQGTGITNSAGSLQSYEDANTIYFYYKGTDNRLYTFVKDKATDIYSQASLYADSPSDVKDMIHVTENHEVFYRNTSDVLTRLNDDGTIQTYSTFPVQGLNIVSKNGRLYYKNSAGIAVLDIATNTFNWASALIADHSFLAMDSEETIFYTSYNNEIMMAQRDVNGSLVTNINIPYKNTPESEYADCNGQMTVNQVSGVLYYVGWNSRVYQLYLNTENEWISVEISIANVGVQDQTLIHYESPHLLYMDDYGNIGNSFYYDNGCLSLVEKNGRLQQSFHINPNPASNVLQLEFESAENSIVKVQLINTIGQLVVSQSLHSGEGLQTQMIDVTELKQGTYYCRLLLDEEEIAYKKLVILR